MIPSVRVRFSQLLIVCAIILVAGALPRSAAAAGRHYWIYEVVLEGTALGTPFERAGQLIVTETITSAGTTNGVNPLDLWLRSGNPAASPEPGAIWFSTNNALIGSRAHVDLAYVSINERTSLVAVTPDARLSAVGANGFNARGGVTADLYQIFDGQMRLQFLDDGQTVTGRLDILGTGALFHSETPYQAVLRGTLTQLIDG